MKRLFWSVLALSALAFTACQQLDFITDKKKKDACFELDYPITWLLPDGSSITENAKDEQQDAIKDWYTDHPDYSADPMLQYPVDIILGDGTIETIQDALDLAIYQKDCQDWLSDKPSDKLSDQISDLATDQISACDFDYSQLSDTTAWEKEIVKPLESNPACDCVVGGLVKYVEISGIRIVYLHYGNGACDGWAILEIGYKPDASTDKLPKICEIDLGCAPDSN